MHHQLSGGVNTGQTPTGGDRDLVLHRGPVGVKNPAGPGVSQLADPLGRAAGRYRAGPAQPGFGIWGQRDQVGDSRRLDRAEVLLTGDKQRVGRSVTDRDPRTGQADQDEREDHRQSGTAQRLP